MFFVLDLLFAKVRRIGVIFCDSFPLSLSCTKRELRKARDEMKSVMKNEKLLETIVQELREEVEEIRKKQLQLDVPGHDEPVRKVCSMFFILFFIHFPNFTF